MNNELSILEHLPAEYATWSAALAAAQKAPEWKDADEYIQFSQFTGWHTRNFRIKKADLAALAANEANRATGRTTRIVNAAIQALFEVGEVIVNDHVDKPQCHKMAYERVVQRLRSEYSGNQFLGNPVTRLIVLKND